MKYFTYNRTNNLVYCEQNKTIFNISNISWIAEWQSNYIRVIFNNMKDTDDTLHFKFDSSELRDEAYSELIELVLGVTDAISPLTMLEPSGKNPIFLGV